MPAAADLSPADLSLAARRARLDARLVELDLRLDAIEDLLDDPHSADFADQATEREGEEVLEATGLSALAERAQIHAALRRLDAGTYGTCARCGEVIDAARLDVLPSTPFCRSCAR